MEVIVVKAQYTYPSGKEAVERPRNTVLAVSNKVGTRGYERNHVLVSCCLPTAHASYCDRLIQQTSSETRRHA
jgi:hypothetical protein